MQSLESVMASLKDAGKPTYLKTYIRHGIPAERTFGVSNADLKVLAKSLNGQQDLALELYQTGNMDAMYLAGIIADGAKMTHEQLEAWAHGTYGLEMIAGYTVPWVTIEHPGGWNLAVDWVSSEDPCVARAGWGSLSGIITVTPDEKLDQDQIEGLMNKVVAEIHSADNAVRSPMNSFIINVGTYVLPLSSKAIEAANRIGVVLVDMGDTNCKIKDAREAIAKAITSGKSGIKRKTIRC
jgi:hypothetical protein